MSDTRLWHGGIPDLKVGDLIRPASETGTERSITRRAAGLASPGHVHLTSDRNAARAYAAAYPNGALYVAEPIGDTEPDPDAPDIAVRCP